MIPAVLGLNGAFKLHSMIVRLWVFVAFHTINFQSNAPFVSPSVLRLRDTLGVFVVLTNSAVHGMLDVVVAKP